MSDEENGNVSYNKQIAGLVLAFVVMLGLHFGPTLPGLNPQGQSVLGVFLWFIICMISEALPRAVVGIASPLFVVILGGFKIGDGFSAFTKNVFFLALGAFVYAGVMMGTPLGRRIAITITDYLRSTRVVKILTGLSLSDLAIGGVLPTVSETALFLPIAKGVTSLMEGREHLPEVRRINNALILLVTGLVPLYTGTLILTSHFPNIILAGTMEEIGVYISWIDWLILNLPLWGLLPIMFFYVIWFFKLWDLEIPGADEALPKMKQELGKITWPEKWALISLAICLFLWITEKQLHNIKTGMVALLLVLLVFLPFGKIEFKKINKYIMWDIWVLLGGAISLGGALYKSGAVSWLAGFVVEPIKSGNITNPIIVLLIVVFGFHIARAGLVSAVAMGATFIPLTMAVASELGFSTLPFTLIVINCLSYAFFLPMSITAFLIAWGASEMSMAEVIKFGVPLSVISNLYVIFVQGAWLMALGYTF